MLGPELVFVGRTEVLFRGERLAFFGGNDYHRLATRPELVEAVAGAAREYGLNSAGSRITTANHPLYVELEATLAGFLGVEAACVCSAGYSANAMLAQAVAPDFQRLFLDASAHPSGADAARLSGLETVRFGHADPDALRAALREQLRPGERPLVLADGVVPGTGALPPIREYASLAAEYGGVLQIDDAHGAGVLGRSGRGSWEEAGLPPGTVLVAGTLSKGLGGFGGFVAGPEELAAKVRSRSTVFVGGTPMPLPLAAAGTLALRILQAEPERIALLRERALAFKERLRELGFRAPEGPAPINSVTFYDETRNRALYDRLLECGIYPPFLNYPGAPAGGHFRFTLSSEHSEEQIARLLGCLSSAV